MFHSFNAALLYFAKCTSYAIKNEEEIVNLRR